MPRMPLEKNAYLWDGSDTLVRMTAEVETAMKAALEAHAWPFIEEMCTWDGGDPDSGILHFRVDPNTDEFPRQAAISTLRKFMPEVPEQAS